MKTSRVVKKVLLSWDLWLAAAITLGVWIAFRDGIPFRAAKEAFGVAIPLLATVFSIYFAAWTILVTTGDNDFIRFLQEHGSFSRILWTFRVSLWLLFWALMISIALFVSVLRWASDYPELLYPWAPLLVFTFFALYALFAASRASADAIRLAELRVRFIKTTHGGTQEEGIDREEPPDHGAPARAP